MGISIKHDEIERMIRQPASKRQTSLVDAVGVAVRNELVRAGIAPMTNEEKERRTAAIRKIQEEVQGGGVDWSETEDEILGYDEFGVPEQPYLSRSQSIARRFWQSCSGSKKRAPSRT